MDSEMVQNRVRIPAPLTYRCLLSTASATSLSEVVSSDAVSSSCDLFNVDSFFRANSSLLSI